MARGTGRERYRSREVLMDCSVRRGTAGRGTDGERY